MSWQLTYHLVQPLFAWLGWSTLRGDQVRCLVAGPDVSEEAGLNPYPQRGGAQPSMRNGLWEVRQPWLLLARLVVAEARLLELVLELPSLAAGVLPTVELFQPPLSRDIDRVVLRMTEHGQHSRPQRKGCG